MSEEEVAAAGRTIVLPPVQTVIAAFTTVIVGFASTILLVVEAARVVGATSAQSASWVAALCFGMAVTTLIRRHRFSRGENRNPAPRGREPVRRHASTRSPRPSFSGPRNSSYFFQRLTEVV